MSTTDLNIEIREAHSDDMPQLLGLWTSLIEHHQVIHAQLYTLKADAELTYEHWLKRRVKEDGARIWVAVEHDVIVGYVLAMVGYRSPVYETRTVGMICDLSVLPSNGRRGIGSMLVSHVLLAFLNQGIDCVQVNYDHQNESAAAFWQKMGFAPRLVEAYRQLGSHGTAIPNQGDMEGRLRCEN